MLSRIKIACAAILLAAVPAQAQRPVVLDSATNVPIRFLSTLQSGRDTVGEPVIVQTLAPLANSACVAAPPYVRMAGHITSSQSGGRFGRRGDISILFDSINASLNNWLPVKGVLDTLEYAGRLSSDGTVSAPRRGAVRHVSTAGAIALVLGSAVEEFPAAVLGTYWAFRHGARAEILAGESGSVSLTQALRVPGAYCRPAWAPVARQAIALPADIPAATSSGHAAGDPINFIFAGTAVQLDSAFAAAGWSKAQRRRPASVAKSIFTTLVALRAANPPVSNQFLFGRAEDVTYELEGPNARTRHHIRIWQLNGQPGMWVGAATLDDGLNLKKRTHRIDPRIDNERDFLVRELEAGGRARLSEYVPLPGAQAAGRLAHGQRFVSDAKAAVMALD